MAARRTAWFGPLWLGLPTVGAQAPAAWFGHSPCHLRRPRCRVLALRDLARFRPPGR